MMTAAAARKTELPSPTASQAHEVARLLPIEEVMSRCDLGRTAIYARIKTRSFPA